MLFTLLEFVFGRLQLEFIFPFLQGKKRKLCNLNAFTYVPELSNDTDALLLS